VILKMPLAFRKWPETPFSQAAYCFITIPIVFLLS